MINHYQYKKLFLAVRGGMSTYISNKYILLYYFNVIFNFYISNSWTNFSKQQIAYICIVILLSYDYYYVL